MDAESDKTASNDTQQVLQQLQALTDGLYWISETEAPFQVIHWPSLQGEELPIADFCQQGNLSADTPIKVLGLADFFAPATQSQSWHGDAETATVEAFQALETFLTEHLQSIRVYCCGFLEQSIYILGRLGDGCWAGLITQGVET
jgi:Nuclease A inhibitor-like protein